MRAMRLMVEAALLLILVGTIGLLFSVQRSLRVMIAMFGAACPIVLLIVTLTLARPGCELDSASVTAVPPTAMRVVAVWTCGSLTCWSRSLHLTDGREIGVAATCESPQGDNLQSPTAAPVVPPS